MHDLSTLPNERITITRRPLKPVAKTMLTLRLIAAVLLAASASAQAREIPNPSLPGSGQSYLSASADGRIYLSWIEPAPLGHRLQFAAWENESWKLVGSVSEGPHWVVNWADYPTFLPLSGGAFIAHWLERAGEGSKYTYGMKVAHQPKTDAPWKVLFAPEVKQEGQYTGFVSLVALAKGMGAAYLAPGTGKGEEDKSLRFVEFARNGSLVSDSMLDPDVCTCCQTAAILTDEGPIIAYRGHTAAEIRDIFVVSLRNGKWSQPRSVGRDDWRINGCPVNGPALAASGKRIAVAWYTEANEKPRVQVAISSDGGMTFGNASRVDDGLAIGRVALVAIPDGSFVVSWLDKKSAKGEIKIRRIGPDGRPGALQTVSDAPPTRKTGFPKMVLSRQKLLLTWTADRVRTVEMAVPE